MKDNDGSRWKLLIGAVAFVTAAGACSSPSGVEEANGRAELADNVRVEEDEGIYVLTQLKDLEAYPEALYRGGLYLDGEGCIRIEQSLGQATMLWPAGFDVRRNGDRIEILDAQGRVVGNLDQQFETGGGYMPSLHSGLGFTERDQELASSRCPGYFWLVTPRTVTTR